MFSVDWQGLLVPFAYILVLGGAFAVFSTTYRKRQAAESASLEPWFGPHLQRNVYLTLVHMSTDPENPTKIPESVLKAALMRRAVEDIRRLTEIKAAKQACSNLLQRGSVGDDLWQRFQRGEKELQDELRDVVMEANTFAPNWARAILGSAHEMHNNLELRKNLDSILDQADAEKEWWEKRRGHIRTEFMKELDEPEKEKETSAAPSDDGVLVDTPDKAKGKKGKN